MLAAFNEAGVEYLLVGGYALNTHGVTRNTLDMDLWVRTGQPNADRIWRALVAFGAPLTDIRLEDFLEPNIIFQIGVAPGRIDILTRIDGVTFDEAWPRRVQRSIAGLTVPVISVEHFMKNKLASGRPQDLADVARLKEPRQ